jgi:hypothetical protein
MAQKLIDAAQRKITRPFNVGPSLLDFDQNVPEYDKQTLMKRSRQAYSNNPLVRAVIQQKAMFTTKNGWQFKSLVEDKQWRVDAEAYFNQWARVACVDGMDFKTLLFQINVSMDRDGDAFIILTSSEDGLYPQLQWVPAQRVATRDNELIVLKGKHTGKKIYSGVIVNSYNRPIAYNILGDDESQDRIVDAINMIHIYDRESGDNKRGIPACSHCLQALEDLHESRNSELLAQRTYASTALIEHLDPIDDNQAFIQTPCGSGPAPQTPLYETFNEGTIVVYRSQGSDLKALETQRPSMQWQLFRDKIIQEIVVSLNWSVSLLDGMDDTSVQNRINIRVAEVTVSDRIALLAPHIQRIAFYVLSKGINNGDLPPMVDYWKMTFTSPPFISADISRIEQSTRENLAVGITTLSEIVAQQGKTLDEHLIERYTDMAKEKLIRAEIEAKYGVSLEQPTPLQ